MVRKKMRSRLLKLTIAVIVLLIVLSLGLYLSLFRVEEGETCLVTTFGKPSRQITEPGRYIKWPVPIQHHHTFDSQTVVFEGRETPTRGAIPITVDTQVVWRIADPLKFFQANKTPESFERKLGSLVFDVNNRVTGRHSLSEFINPDPSKIKLDEIQNEMFVAVRQVVSDKAYGVEIEEFSIAQVRPGPRGLFEPQKSVGGSKATTLEALPIIVDTCVVYRIADPPEFFRAGTTPQNVKEKIRHLIVDTKERVISRHSLFEFINSDSSKIKRDEIQDEMLVDLQQAVSDDGYAIEITTFDITQVTESASEPPLPQKSVSSNGTSYRYGKIAFVSSRDGNPEIYVMNEDGSGQENLTSSPASDLSPEWSPDATRIAFTRESRAKSDIYIMNADGSEQVRLTDNPGGDIRPSWAMDGGKIAFVSPRDGVFGVYVVDANGQHGGSLAPDIGSYATSGPRWSPREQKIAFHSYRDRNIHVVNSDGSEHKMLTTDSMYNSHPCWSPDGKKIAFWSRRDGQGDIFVMNADGTDQRNITEDPAVNMDPCWSPDGRKIAFLSISGVKPTKVDICVINPDGSGRKNLTDDQSISRSPDATKKPVFLYSDQSISWSPDGKKIAFASDRDGNREIYVMNSDGSGQKRLTINSAYDGNPVWSPLLPAD